MSLMRTYKTEGVVLKRTNFGEADRILTLYTSRFGKTRVLAKGIRKPTSRKSSSLELFNWVRIFVAKGRNLDIVTETEVVKTFRDWRKDLKKVSLAYHFCELIDRLTAEQSPSKEVFILLTRSLDDLSSHLNGQQKKFEQKLLEEIGFWPKDRPADGVDLEAYIEKIIERKIVSLRIFKDLAS